MTDNPANPRIATEAMVAKMRPISEAPRGPIIHLLWEDGGRWLYQFGIWRDDVGAWCAEMATTTTLDLPGVPTHWADF